MLRVNKQFSSLSEMVAFTDSDTRINGSRLFGYEHRQDESFTLTRDFKAAQKLCKSGWTQGAKQLESAMNEAVNEMSFSQVIGSEYDVVGPIPDIGAYCAGDPECMLSPSEPMEVPVVRIIVDANMVARITHEQSMTRGAAILALCNKIEKSGRRVEIIATCTARITGSSSPGIGTYGVVVKPATGDFNLYTLAYCFVHPSYYRRHGFKIWDMHGYDSSSSKRSDNHGAHEFYGKPDLYFPCINEVPGHRQKFYDIRSAVAYVNEVADESGIFA